MGSNPIPRTTLSANGGIGIHASLRSLYLRVRVSFCRPYAAIAQLAEAAELESAS